MSLVEKNKGPGYKTSKYGKCAHAQPLKFAGKSSRVTRSRTKAKPETQEPELLVTLAAPAPDPF